MKKVYSNVQGDDQLDDLNLLSRKPQTIVDLDTKHNVITQTPIPFLRVDKPIKYNLVDHDLKDKPLKDQKIQLNDLNDKKTNKLESTKKEIKDERKNSIKKLFPSVNKFKQLNLSKSTSSSKHSTSANPFASSSNKSTLKTEFINKITTKKSFSSTTAKPIYDNQIKQVAKSSLKVDKSRPQITTTTEKPKFVYKTTKRTTTYKPYVYSTTTSSTIEPILRIRKSKPTTVAQTIKPTFATGKPSFLNEKFNKKNLSNDIIKDDKRTTNSIDKYKSDLEPHNSSRKYAKLFFNKKSSDQETNDRSYTTPLPIRTTKPFLTTTTPSSILQTRSYLRTNSRTFTTVSYSPTEPDYSTTTYKSYTYSTISEPTRSTTETVTESLIKNEINRDKILTASRKKPIHRPRTVRPTQLAHLTTISQPKLDLTTQTPLTTYSPRFRSTTTYSPRFRSTTQTSSANYLSQFVTSTTPLSVTTSEYKYKGSDNDEYTINELIPQKSTTEFPATSRFYSDKNEKSQDNFLNDNLIPRKPKWVLKDDKGSRQKKSDLSYITSVTPPSYSYQTNTVYSNYVEETTVRPILRTYVTTISSIDLKKRLEESVKNIDENEIPKYKSVEKSSDRTPKSVDAPYQMRRPQPFLIDEKSPSLMVNLKYEEPKRNSAVANANENDPDKEIYYRDPKIRKESKLIPQTYLYSTSAPSLDQLNERLSYLNEEKAKYKRPYFNNNDKISHLENKKYEKPSYLENSRSNVYQPKEIDEVLPEDRYPNLPTNIPYLPNKKQNTRYNDENKRPSPLPIPENINEIDNQPYIKSHFNLGHLPANSPKYGNPFKVGKLSKPFSNQAPIPYFEPNDSNENPNDNINPPELFRYPVRKNELSEKNDNRVHKHIDLRPFDFKDYNKLPDAKYIRTDLDSERLAKSPPNIDPTEKEYRKTITNEHPKLIEDNGYRKQFDHTYSPKEHKPIEYNQPPSYKQNEYTQKPYPQYYTQPPYLNYESKPERPKEYSTDKNVRFNFNKIPAKVVYDKYNQKFSGHVNLKPTKRPPISLHYANIPKEITPIEYQRKPINSNNNFIKPIQRPIEHPVNREEYRPIYNNQVINRPTYRPVYNDYNSNNYEDVNLKRPIYNERNKFKEPEYDRMNNHSPVEQPKQPEYRPIYNNQINRPVNHPNQIANHMPNKQDNLRFIYPSRHKNEDEEPRNDYRPVYYNPNQPIYYNQFINHDQNNNNNQYNLQHNLNDKRSQYENNNLINLNQGNNQFNNAGHYNRINLKPTKDIELINLNDIRPNLSLFNNKLPDFRLLQNTVISHDIPL